MSVKPHSGKPKPQQKQKALSGRQNGKLPSLKKPNDVFGSSLNSPNVNGLKRNGAGRMSKCAGLCRCSHCDCLHDAECERLDHACDGVGPT